MLGATAVRRYLAVVGNRGVPPEVMFANSGLSHAALAQPSFLMTPPQYRTIVSNLVNLSGEEGIGLAGEAFRDLGDLGIVGHASAASRTVRDTYRVWTRFGPALVGMMGQLCILEEDARTVTFGVASPDPMDPLYRFSVEELLTMVRKVSRAPVDGCPSVRELSLSYRAPRHAERYEEMFGCPMRFGAPRTTIRVWKEWFDSAAQPHDQEFNALCLQHCESVLRRVERSEPMKTELRELFARSQSSPLPRLEAAAQLLKLTPRTLRRRLHEEGTSYRSEADGFRMERAKQYLAYDGASAKEVAFLLGFKEQSAFRNAFKSWTGMTTREYRRAALGSGLAKSDGTA